MYFNQKYDFSSFWVALLSSSAKYALQVVNMVVDQPFWTISKSQIKLDQKVA